jgi:hypothetical protein
MGRKVTALQGGLGDESREAALQRQCPRLKPNYSFAPFRVSQIRRRRDGFFPREERRPSRQGLILGSRCARQSAAVIQRHTEHDAPR